MRARWGGGRRGDLGRERARHGAREGTSRRRLEWKRRTWPCAGRRCWRWSGRGEAARAEERRLGLGQGRGGQGGWCAERAEAPWLTAFGELLGQGRRSEKRNTARTTAAPSPDTPPPTRLLELLVRALSRCDPADIARVAAVLRLAALSERVRFCFCCSFTPRCAGAHPLVGARARLRAAGAARGRELRRAVAVLCCAACCARPTRRRGWQQAFCTASLFIDGEGQLSSCGCSPDHVPGSLGHGEGVTRLNTPARLPSSLGGERAVRVSVPPQAELS